LSGKNIVSLTLRTGCWGEKIKDEKKKLRSMDDYRKIESWPWEIRSEALTAHLEARMTISKPRIVLSVGLHLPLGAIAGTVAQQEDSTFFSLGWVLEEMPCPRSGE